MNTYQKKIQRSSQNAQETNSLLNTTVAKITRIEVKSQEMKVSSKDSFMNKISFKVHRNFETNSFNLTKKEMKEDWHFLATNFLNPYKQN